MRYLYKRLIFCIMLASPTLFLGAQELAENETESTVVGAQDSSLVQVAFREVAKSDLMGGVSVLNMSELINKNYNTYSLDNLQGYVGGFNGNSLWGMDSYLVLIDGVPRAANNVMPTEIEQITFLKGASAVVLYGSRAAKGVMLITTKKGAPGDLKIDVRANATMDVHKSYPEYLGSAEYMTLYNEALVNDGRDPLYSDLDIYNYGSGLNPYRYPDVNLYSSDYIKKATSRLDATAEISGGNDLARFYSNISYYRADEAFKFGEAEDNYIDRFNVRGNVDLNLGKAISAYVNTNVTFYNARGARSENSYWSNASTLRPNRIAPLVPLSYLDENATVAKDLVANSNNIIDGEYFLGGTQSDLTNIFGDYYAAGNSKFTSRQFQFDAGVNISLSSLLEGLSFGTQFALDYATSYNTSYENEYATYRPTWSNYNGKDMIVDLTKYNQDKSSGVQNISGSTNNKTILFSGQFNYDRVFDDVHYVNVMLLGSGYQQTYSGEYHATSNANLGFQANYNYDRRYYLEFGAAVLHSARLASGSRNALSPSATIGWNLKRESFLADNSIFDELSVSASVSSLNTDMGIDDYYMYKPVFVQSDGAWWGWRESVAMHSTNSKRGGNEDLTFIKRKEIAFNLKTSLLNRLITADVSVFTNTMEGGVIRPTTVFPSYFSTYYPEASFVPYVNYNDDKRMGFDFSVGVNKRINEVDLSLGVNGTYYTTEAARRNENYENEYQNRQGKALDAIWGYECLGFFQSDEDVQSSPEQKIGGTQRAGDLKYKDQNGDGIIDNKDQVELGKGGWYGAPLTLGVNFSASWKGLTLFVLGTGNYGAQGVKNTDYHWISGDDKYSAVVRDRWTEANKDNALYPRLTTESGDNNFQTSDFWLYDTDAFRLAKVQLTYDFSSEIFKNSFVDGLSVYVSGSNLLTISDEREYLEMNIGSAPQTRSYNVGLKVSF